MSEAEVRADGGSLKPLRRSARALARLDLTVLGAGFAWFAYIDAPITDGAMRLFALAAVAGLLALIAALISADTKSAKSALRLQRAALYLFIATTALMVTAATVTLNLKGTGTEESDTQTAVVMRA